MNREERKRESHLALIIAGLIKSRDTLNVPSVSYNKLYNNLRRNVISRDKIRQTSLRTYRCSLKTKKKKHLARVSE